MHTDCRKCTAILYNIKRVSENNYITETNIKLTKISVAYNCIKKLLFTL